MPNQNHAESIKVAAALAEFDPVFLAALDRSLESWIGKNAKGPASLVWMRPFCRKGYSRELGQLLASIPSAKVQSFAAKLDKFNPMLMQLSSEEIIEHIVKIASGDVEPLPKQGDAPRAAKNASGPKRGAPKLNVREIIGLDDAGLRNQELLRLTDAELKVQLREVGMDVPTTLKKAERIRFIQDELAAGWPNPRSVLDSSRY